MICLLSAPNGLLPHMRKRRTVGRAQGGTALFLRRCCCGTKKNNCSQLSDTSCGGVFFVFFVFPLLDAAGIKWRDGGALRQLFPFWFTAALPSTRQKLACPPLGQRKPADPADFRQVFFCPPPPTFPNFAPSLRAQQCGLNKTQCSTVPLSTTRPPPSSCLSPPSSAFSNTQTPARTRAQ